jgi:N-ethylmaleimide reductase
MPDSSSARHPRPGTCSPQFACLKPSMKRERLTVSKETLFSSLRLGAIQLPNRIIMAPLTRMRAGAENVPTPLNAEYYAQRSSAGLIISEGTAISPQGQGFPNAPGIYTAAQIAGWRRVTHGVHARGGRIIMQIAHNGRNSHSSLLPDGGPPVAPSAIPPTIPALTKDFQQVPAETPRALETSEIAIILGTFRQAALNAIEAGFDGVELQGANSHLIEQFLENGTNQRTDAYGGSKENRARFLLEIVDEVTAAIGANRLGVRLSPFGQYGGIHDSNPLELFTFVIKELSERRIAFLHLIEARGSEIGLTDELHKDALNNAALFRPFFDGPLLSAAAYTPESAAEAIENSYADAIAFGRLFVANPDLVERIREDKPLNLPDRATFYGGGAHGYTDYKLFGAPV